MLRSNPATSVSLEGSSTVVRAPTERQADQDVGLLLSGSVDLLEGMDASPPALIQGSGRCKTVRYANA